MVNEVLAEIPTAGKAPLERARAIYDHVIENMEHKKVGTGWGNGDTFWACNERHGNCTDYHALFISLARRSGIPARFETGCPVPEDKEAGAIGGYRRWVEFYAPEVGRFPIDAFEADKHPERRELLFGTHLADRVQLTVGRALELGAGHDSGSPSYFVYPHVGLGDRVIDEHRTEVRYKEVTVTRGARRELGE
ncbi:MAG: transglutaminase domain-containing protein [Gammaproteobacteria bacterium]|nr:transglutaminase domain-containing protein [Gammaproteobacteria bacterium]